MNITQIKASENYMNKAFEAKDGDTGIKDISNKANSEPESGCVYNQGDTLNTDAYGLFASSDKEEEETDNSSVKENEEVKLSDKLAIEEGEAIKDTVAKIDESVLKEVVGEKSFENELTLDEYTATALDRAIKRVASGRADSEKRLDEEVLKIREEITIKEEKSDEAIALKQMEENIILELKKQGVSVLPGMVTRIQDAWAMSFSAKNISMESVNYLIRQKLPPTIENVYMAGHKSYVDNKEYEIPKDLEKQIRSIIGEIDEKKGDYLLGTAKTMLKEHIGVTKDNLKFHSDMKDAVEHYDKETMLSKIVENVAIGGAPKDTWVTKDRAYENIKVLEEALDNSPYNAKVFLAKRTLNEVRLAMTSNASVKMAVKNIDVDISDITKALDELNKTCEELYIRTYLKDKKGMEKGLDLNDVKVCEKLTAQAKTMYHTKESISLISYNKEVLVTATFGQRETIKLGNFENAINRYEESETRVRKDLGDSIKKAFDSIPELLSDLSLEATDSNVRAVRELSYASIEITAQTIDQMKAYDTSFDTLTSNLTPSVTKKLIENGINPLEMTVEELNARALEIKEELGVEDTASYAKFLYRLDKEGSISKEMRDAYIGIYRLIKNIQNTDGAAVSVAYKAGMDMTLNNLLTCMRTYKSKGVDSVVDDVRGGVQLVEKNDENMSIDTQINQISFYNATLDKLADDVSPQLIMEYEATHDKAFVDENIEVLEDMAVSAKITDKEGYKQGEEKYLEAVLNNAKEGLKNASDGALSLRTLGFSVNVGNLIGMHFYGKNLGGRVKNEEKSDDNDNMKNLLSEEEMDGVFQDMDSFVEKINRVYDDLSDDLYKVTTNSLDANEVMAAGFMLKNITFSRKMMDKNCYEIPLSTDAGITNIKLQFAKNEETSGQVNILMQDEMMGEVNVTLKLKGEARIKGFVACETRVGYEFFAREKASFLGSFARENIDVISVDYALGKKTKSYYSEADNEFSKNATDTENNRLLLTAAKITIRHIVKGIGEINENQS